jgi:predicted nuclease of predicted toxin-antitoxin system
MRFFLDENFPKSAAKVLEDLGHECDDPRGTDLEGSDDSVLVEEARRLGAIILTTDRDFFHTLRHQYPDHSGVVVVALKQPNRAAIIKRLKWLLENIPEEQLAERAFQLRDNTWAVQPPLGEQ